MIELERRGVVLSPREGGYGAFSRFNAGAVREGDAVHVLYRASHGAIADKAGYTSTIGYARLGLDGTVLADPCEPVIAPELPEERRGCEDPRIVEFEGRYLVFYCAYSGDLTRVGVKATRDFASFERIGVVGHELWDKDAFIVGRRLPRGICYVHRVEPDIQMEYLPSLEALVDPASWRGYGARREAGVVMRRERDWEARKIGGSIPPIETREGWLFFYHGVTEDYVYRAGAALLDGEDPRRVVARLPYPVLEPREPYELEGDVPNVVFPEGAYLVGDAVNVLYGAADRVVARAEVGLDDLLAELRRHPVRRA